ncbi:hypothetical protein CPJCM30710_33450 [Clostridium polyendosporum]|uniref:Lipoprotein n=1 Tax=Clostridium polyendosporum TaxID=69208 RepID=A0A919S3A1_9CLOT|nr:hypothetical protein [Clostridium polyendosporum]GIM30679.1 hypothetical protein CPJCM30710_33450 [Clostridium polyendosporum]
MKKIIVIMITLAIILTGCSDEKKPVNNTVTENTSSEKKPTNDTVAEDASSSDNQQSQPQPENTSESAKDTNSNTNSNLLENIDTTKSQFEKGYYDYQGTINNNIPIHMSLYPLDKDIVGGYFYDSKRIELQLKGKAGEKDIVLYEYNEAGKNTGIFKGTMTTVDKIKGTWMSPDNKKSYPFVLSLSTALPGAEYGKRYASALGTTSDQETEAFVTNIQNCVLKNDKKQLAELIHYPITVNIDGKATSIQNKEDFINNYDKIFYPDFKQIISNAFTKYMFANWRGVMFGDNRYNMWISKTMLEDGTKKVVIRSINN